MEEYLDILPLYKKYKKNKINIEKNEIEIKNLFDFDLQKDNYMGIKNLSEYDVYLIKLNYKKINLIKEKYDIIKEIENKGYNFPITYNKLKVFI